MKEIIFGINPVYETLRSQRRKIFSINFSSENGRIRDIIKLADQYGIKSQKSDKTQLSKLAGTEKHQGIIAIVSEYKYYNLDEIIKNEKKFTNLILLDGITDPHNLGAIIRSADIFDFDGVIIRKERAAKINGTVIKTSAGATEHVKIAMETNFSRTVEYLQKNGFWIYAATEKTDELIYNMNFKFNTVIIIGDEGKGISQNLLKKSDFRFKIPVLGKVSSLNASVSSAISMYEVIRQQKIGG